MNHRERLWKLYLQKNPSLAKEGNITLTSAGFRKFFDLTYEEAYKLGETNGAAEQIAKNKQATKLPDFAELASKNRSDY